MFNNILKLNEDEFYEFKKACNYLQYRCLKNYKTFEEFHDYFIEQFNLGIVNLGNFRDYNGLGRIGYRAGKRTFYEEEHDRCLDIYYSINDRICLKNLIKYKHINMLNLSSCNVKDVFGIEELINLKYLDLSLNSSLKITKDLNKLEKLEYLNLSLTAFDNCELLNLKSLKHLNISNSFIKDLNLPFNILKNLEYLDIQNIKISELSNDFSQLSNLKTLNMSEIKFREFPKVLLNCDSIDKLFVNKIKDLELIGKINLKSLTVDRYYGYNKNIILPNNIYKINNLFLDCNNRYYVKYKTCNLKYHKDIINKDLKIKYNNDEHINVWKPSIFNIKKLGINKKLIDYFLAFIYYSNLKLNFDVQSIIIEYLIFLYFKNINSFFI